MAQFVDRFGFVELPEDFFNRETQQKIILGIDVRQEYELLQRNIDFVNTQGIDLDVSWEVQRTEIIKQNFQDSFQLADLRAENEKIDKEKSAIENTNNFNKSFGLYILISTSNTYVSAI